MNNLNVFGNIACSNDWVIGSQDEKLVISSEEDWLIVNWLRSRTLALGIGSNTILIDDPSLSIKTDRSDVQNEFYNPIPIVFDRRGRVNGSQKIFKQIPVSEIIIVSNSTNHDKIATMIEFTNWEGTLNEITKYLRSIKEIDPRVERKQFSLMIEGGATLLTSLLHSKAISKLRIFKSNENISQKLVKDCIRFDPADIDVLQKYYRLLIVNQLETGLEYIHVLK